MGNGKWKYKSRFPLPAFRFPTYSYLSASIGLSFEALNAG